MQPDDPVITFIREWLWGPVLAFIAWAWSYQERRHESMRRHVDVECKRLNDEVLRQRDLSGEIFRKLDENNLRSEKRHIELLKALHDGLDRKMDKP